MTKMATMPIYGKTHKKNFYFGTDRPLLLKLGIQHQTLNYYQIRSNDDPKLTFDLFTERSTLVPYTFIWVKA